MMMVPPPPPPPVPQVLVLGNANLLREQSRVDQVIWPDETFRAAPGQELSSNIIDHKRFVEAVATRCFASTVLQDPDAIEPQFVVVSRNGEVRVNATESAERILRSGFEPRKRTTLIIHGFTQSYPNTEWLRRVRALFESNSIVGKQNLIIMDWGGASQGSYAQVAATVSGMGSFLTNFLLKLTDDLGADRTGIHIIGHSLGAHLAGFAGKRMRPKLGRITALDPAGPCFGKFFSNSPSDRLSANDALEVDVYHYDDGFLGLAGQHGHFDVYVNGGASQPGAADNANTMVSAAITMMFRRNRILSESHTRSTEVPATRLAHCQQVAHECRDWPAFLSGECGGACDEQNSQCFFMGFHFQYQDMAPAPLRVPAERSQQNQIGKRLYIATGESEKNFCLQHYQLLVRLEPQAEIVQAARKQKWRVFLELTTESFEQVNVTISYQMSPTVYSYLLLSETRPAPKFRSALLQLRKSDNSVVQIREQRVAAPNFNAHSPFKVSSVEVNFMSNIEPKVRRATSSRLCPSGVAQSRADAEWLVLNECNGF